MHPGDLVTELEPEPARSPPPTAPEELELAWRRRFEAELAEHRLAQVAETERQRQELLAILAHELRNPLQPLQTAIEVMEHDPDKPVPERIREIIKSQVQLLTRLIDDLLDVTKFTSGKLELRRAPITLDAVVDEAVASTRTVIEARKHALEIGSRDQVRVHGDTVRLVKCLVNLISNAAKHTPIGGRIQVAFGSDKGEAFMRVTDNGKGIAPELLPSIFEMFVPERVTPDGAGGLGLGLGLVRRLVELHGGTVHASSGGEGLGSVFEIRLPASET